MTNEKECDVTDKRPLKSLAATLALLATTLLAGCDGGGPFGLFGTKSPWPVTDSRIAYATRFEGDPIYWLDNHRVLLPGYERRAEAPGKEAPEQFGPLGLYVWDTRTNTTTRQSDLSEHYSLCYNDGFITYTTSDENGRKRHQSEGGSPRSRRYPSMRAPVTTHSPRTRLVLESTPRSVCALSISRATCRHGF